MATEIERLVVSLEASITKYEKAMQKAATVGDRRAKQIEDRFRKTASIIDASLARVGRGAFRGFVRGAALALAPVLSVAAAVDTAKRAMQEFGDIADNAKAAGLDPELFQSLAHSAELSGVALGVSADALATFAKNSGLAVEGKGKMVAALKALNPALLENIRSATTQEERIRIVADALDKEKDAARRAAIATALFGEAGIKMADSFDGGARAIDAAMAKAKDMGIIVDRDLIARADQLGDEFDTATRVLDLQFKEILIELAPLLTGTAQAISGVVMMLRDLGAAIASMGNADSIGDVLDPLAGRSVAKLEKDLAEWKEMQKPGHSPMFPQMVEREIAAIEAELRLRKVVGSFDGNKSDAGSFADLQTQFTKPRATLTLDEIDSRDEAAKAALRQAEKVKDLIADLQAEGAQIGKTALQQQVLANLHRVGAEAASEEGREIARLTEANYNQQQQVAALAEVYAELGNIGKAAVNDIIDAMADGKIEAEEFGQILSNVLGMAGQFFLNQAFGSFGNGGNSVLGTLFGGGRAAGGPVEAGKIYKVNENTPNSEYFAPGMSGMIIPRLGKASSSVTSGGAVFHIDARGAQLGVGAEIQRALEHFDRFRLPQRVSQINADPLARG